MSDQDQTIFDSHKTPEDQQQKHQQNSSSDNSTGEGANQRSEPFADLLGSIKNERGEPKYKSTEDALKALSNAQQFIPQLQEENKELRQKYEELARQLDKFKHIEESIERLSASQRENGQTSQVTIDENMIAEIAERTLSQREALARQQSNLKLVTDTVISKFGEAAEKEFYKRASDVGMSASEINSLAAKNPLAALRLIGLQSEGQKTNVHSGAKTEVNTAGFEPKQESFVSRNRNRLSVGATTEDYQAEAEASKRMVEELHSQGVSVSDLSDPKKYFKTFK